MAGFKIEEKFPLVGFMFMKASDVYHLVTFVVTFVFQFNVAIFLAIGPM